MNKQQRNNNSNNTTVPLQLFFLRSISVSVPQGLCTLSALLSFLLGPFPSLVSLWCPLGPQDYISWDSLSCIVLYLLVGLQACDRMRASKGGWIFHELPSIPTAQHPLSPDLEISGAVELFLGAKLQLGELRKVEKSLVSWEVWAHPQ